MAPEIPLEKRVDRLEWRADQRDVERVEEKKVLDERLRLGAGTFSKLIGWVKGSAGAALFAAGGMLWNVATTWNDQKHNEAQVSELRQWAAETTKDAEATRAKMGLLEAQLREEKDRRAVVEETLRALSTPTPRRR
jgi:hypothetical protein